MRQTKIDGYEDTPRDIVATANDYPAAAVAVARHHHRRAQLLYSVSGVLRVIAADSGWVLPPQRALWIPAGIEHEVLRPGHGGGVSLYSAYVRGEAAQRAGLPAQCRVIAVSPLLRALLMEAVDLPARHALDGRDGRLMGLLLDEIQRMPVLPLSAPLPVERRLARLCRRLLEKPALEADIDTVAAAAGMSRRHFTRLFRAQTGMSFAAWRQQACLLAALARLGSGEPVTKVALDLGYSSPGAFGVAFRRTLGVPPSRYLAS